MHAENFACRGWVSRPSKWELDALPIAELRGQVRLRTGNYELYTEYRIQIHARLYTQFSIEQYNIRTQKSFLKIGRQ